MLARAAQMNMPVVITRAQGVRLVQTPVVIL
jgi:hypothetical protein